MTARGVSQIAGVDRPSVTDDLGIVKYTLLEFLKSIIQTFRAKEELQPRKISSLLSMSPSTKMTILQSVCSRMKKEDITHLYVEFIMETSIADIHGELVPVESYLRNRDERFILKDIFKLIPIAKKEDIELFSEIWTGFDVRGTPTKLVRLTDSEKQYTWQYFDIISKKIHSWRGITLIPSKSSIVVA